MSDTEISPEEMKAAIKKRTGKSKAKSPHPVANFSASQPKEREAVTEERDVPVGDTREGRRAVMSVRHF